MRFPGRGRRTAISRRSALHTGGAVDIAGRMRRTSARGWSPWIVGVARLPGPEGGTAYFVADTPGDVALVSGRAGRSGPIPLARSARLTRRDVRFKGEAYYGDDAQIIVLHGDPAVTELDLDPADIDAVVDRLLALGNPLGSA